MSQIIIVVLLPGLACCLSLSSDFRMVVLLHCGIGQHLSRTVSSVIVLSKLQIYVRSAPFRAAESIGWTGSRSDIILSIGIVRWPISSVSVCSATTIVPIYQSKVSSSLGGVWSPESGVADKTNHETAKSERRAPKRRRQLRVSTRLEYMCVLAECARECTLIVQLHV